MNNKIWRCQPHIQNPNLRYLPLQIKLWKQDKNNMEITKTLLFPQLFTNDWQFFTKYMYQNYYSDTCNVEIFFVIWYNFPWQIQNSLNFRSLSVKTFKFPDWKTSLISPCSPVLPVLVGTLTVVNFGTKNRWQNWTHTEYVMERIQKAFCQSYLQLALCYLMFIKSKDQVVLLVKNNHDLFVPKEWCSVTKWLNAMIQ